jgi:Mn2+/Fe2+ NRAMP family transporter
MGKEIKVLNFICVVTAVAFLAAAVLILLTAGELLTTDNLFFTMVCLVMALLFAVNPLLYLKSIGKLPIPFLKGSPVPVAQVGGSSASPRQIRNTASSVTPVLLDAKGRAVPPDVQAMVSRMGQTEPKDA